MSTKITQIPTALADPGGGLPIAPSPSLSHPAPRARRAEAPSSEGRGREARLLRRADALIASGQIEKALTHLRKLVTDLPKSTMAYLRIAMLLRERKRPIEALEILRSAVAHTPDAPAPREALAEICLESGRWDEAIQHARYLLNRSPRSLFARDVLAAAYLKRGYLDQALRITNEMVLLDPYDASNHFKRGVLLQQKGQIAAAIQAFVRVLETNPDQEVAEESRAALEMLDSHQIRQILTLAVEDVTYRVWLRRDPAEAVAAKGYALSEAGLAAVAQVNFEHLPDAPAGWRHYSYQ